MLEAYKAMYNIVLPILGLIMIACLVKAIRGPRIADRIIAVNMMGTTVVITICILAFVMGEGYLTDVAIVYTTLSFLAVVLLTKVYMGIYREKRRKEEEAQKNA